MAEDLRYKLSLDTSDLQQATQQMHLLSQQYANNVSNNFQSNLGFADNSTNSLTNQMALMNQQQAMFAAANMANGGAGFSPYSTLAQNAYFSSLNNMGGGGSPFGQSFSTPFGSPMINPYQYPVSMQNNAYGYNPGQATFPEQFGRPGFANLGVSAAHAHPFLTSAAGGGLIGGLIGAGKGFMSGGFGGAALGGLIGGVGGAALAPATVGAAGNLAINAGMPSLARLGLGAGPLDMPMYKQIQNFGEVPAEALGIGGLKAAQYGMQAGLVATSLGSAYAGFRMGGVGGAALGAVGGAAAYAGNELFAKPFLQGPREYLELGRYFRDSMAPAFRGEKLGGGPNFESMQKFEQGFANKVGKDEYLTRDDYTKLFQLANDTGLTMMAGNTDKLLGMIENVAKSAKAVIQLGTRIKDLNSTMQNLTMLGVDITNPNQVAGFMGSVQMNAFSAGKTPGAMMQGMVEASSLSRQQGLAPAIGANLYQQSSAIVGEAIRSGSFTPGDMAYYGGQQGMENSMTRFLSAGTRTSVGRMMMMSMANNPDLINQQGYMTMPGLLGEMNKFSTPEMYNELEYRMPELSRGIDLKNPGALGVKLMGNQIEMLRRIPGMTDRNGKINVGNVYRFLENSGMNPDDIRVFLHSVENAPKVTEGMNRSTQDVIRQREMESLRPPGFNIFSEQGRQNIMEKFFEPAIGGWAAGMQGKIGAMSHYFEDMYVKNLSGGEVIRRPESLTNTALVGNLSELENNSTLRNQANNLLSETMGNISSKIIENNPNLYKGVGQQLTQEHDAFLGELKDLRERGPKGGGEGVASHEQIVNLLDKLKDGTISDSERSALRDFIKNAPKDRNADVQSILNAQSKPSNVAIVNRVNTEQESLGNIARGYEDPDSFVDDKRRGFVLTDSMKSSIKEGRERDLLNDISGNRYGKPYKDLPSDQQGVIGAILSDKKLKGIYESVNKGGGNLAGKSFNKLKEDFDKTDFAKLFKDITGNEAPTDVNQIKMFTDVFNKKRMEMNKSGSILGSSNYKAMQDINKRLGEFSLQGNESLIREYEKNIDNYSLMNSPDAFQGIFSLFNDSPFEDELKSGSAEDLARGMSLAQQQLNREMNENLRKKFPEFFKGNIDTPSFSGVSASRAGELIKEEFSGYKEYQDIASKIVKDPSILGNSNTSRQLQDAINKLPGGGSINSEDVGRLVQDLRSQSGKKDNTERIAKELSMIGQTFASPEMDSLVTGGKNSMGWGLTAEQIKSMTKNIVDQSELTKELNKINLMLSKAMTGNGLLFGNSSVQPTVLNDIKKNLIEINAKTTPG